MMTIGCSSSPRNNYSEVITVDRRTLRSPFILGEMYADTEKNSGLGATAEA
jgi:hypothetical protein